MIVPIWPACSEVDLRAPDVDVLPPTVAAPEPDIWVEERFDVPAQADLDVLLLLDDSCSMLEETWIVEEDVAEMIALLRRAPSFHLGFTSMKMADSGRLLPLGGEKWLDDTSELPEADVARAVEEMYTTGFSSVEQGLDATWLALGQRAGGYNEGFRRTGADLAVVWITDEDDQSELVGPAEVAELLVDLVADGGLLRVIAVVAPIVDEDLVGQGAAFNGGARYLETAELVGGVDVPLVAPFNWGALLGDVGEALVGVRDRFPLRDLPRPETLSVSVANDDAVSFPDAATWTWAQSENAIVFVDAAPMPGSTVEIRYALAR